MGGDCFLSPAGVALTRMKDSDSTGEKKEAQKRNFYQGKKLPRGQELFGLSVSDGNASKASLTAALTITAYRTCVTPHAAVGLIGV